MARSARSSAHSFGAITACVTATRPSKTLNGPTSAGTPGSEKPNASRLIFWREAVPRTLACGIEVGERLQPVAFGNADALLAQDESQVVAQRAVDRVGEAHLQHLAGRDALRNATEDRRVGDANALGQLRTQRGSRGAHGAYRDGQYGTSTLHRFASPFQNQSRRNADTSSLEVALPSVMVLTNRLRVTSEMACAASRAGTSRISPAAMASRMFFSR